MAKKRRENLKDRFQQAVTAGHEDDSNLLETLNARRSSQDGKLKRKANFYDIPLVRIKRYTNQPRQHFDNQSLQELADSMAANGQIEPITVIRDGDTFLLEVGERRLRAAQLLKWQTITAEIIDSEDNLRAASRRLIENVMRDDLSSVEKANGLLELKALIGEGATWPDVEKQTGLGSRRRKQLLATKKLPEEIQQAIIKGKIADRHAQALLHLKTPAQQLKVFQRIKEENLNSDEVRHLVSDILKKPKQKSPELKRLVITYNSLNELIDKVESTLKELKKQRSQAKPLSKAELAAIKKVESAFGKTIRFIKPK